MNAVVDAANAKDAAKLRGAVEDFLREVTSQSQNGDITAVKAQDLRTVASRLLTNASILEQSTVPSPAPSSAAPAPSPTAAPPSPSPTAAPPSQPPSPSPTAAPPSPSPIASIGFSSSPVPLSRPS